MQRQPEPVYEYEPVYEPDYEQPGYESEDELPYEYEDELLPSNEYEDESESEDDDESENEDDESDDDDEDDIDPCISVNAFVRAVDAKIAAKMKLNMQCNDLRVLFATAAETYGDKSNGTFIKSITTAILGDVTCRGDIVANVAAIRRLLARVSCTTSGGQTKISQLPATDAPPLPQGFVLPRLLDSTWTPQWAKSNGWIQDPYYDWLMPVQQVPRKGTAPSVSSPAPATDLVPTVPAVAAVEAVPAVEAVQIAETPVVAPKSAKSWLVWLCIVITCLALLGGGWWWWSSRASGGKSKDLGEFGTQQIDSAFDNSGPPTDMSGADQGFGPDNSNEWANGEPFAGDVPNASELMNDVGPNQPGPSRTSRR
jgi:hypothetical protein